MIIIDEMGERALRPREGETFLDRYDIVTPTVHHHRRAARNLRCRWQARQIEGRRQQKEAAGLQRSRCRSREKSAQAGPDEQWMRGQLAAAGQQFGESCVDAVDATIIH